MEYRQLGRSGLSVPVLSFGTATFAGGEQEGSWGNVQVDEARRMVDLALDAGINFFDTADIYSGGRAEKILGQAVADRRDQVLIGTKANGRTGTGRNDAGSSRHHLTRALEASLNRLDTDYVDVYYLHGFDALTPVDEVLSTLDDFVRSGKVRYIGCSNFSGWQLMKSLSVSERYGWGRYVAHQAFYSLASREFEWELMPLAVDQGVGTVVWSPLSQGRLTGKLRRNTPVPADSRLAVPGETEASGDRETLYRTVDVLDELANETGKTIPQLALNWVLSRPTVSSIIFGARNEAQFAENLGAVGWSLDADQIARLDAASALTPIYPYWHQVVNNSERLPFPTSVIVQD
ncbi:aldo/keto reductase [Microbacterium pumilum]|uniref:Aldo/keto reductase n=1 Tax=Microbacterium pumilum TaxID=344165 RepID=A0ABN2S4N1_9MICO